MDETSGNTEEKKVEETPKPVNIVEEAAAIRDEIRAERQKLEEANTKREEIQANEMLSGTSGGHVAAKQVSPEEEKANQAAEFFKDTQLEKDIRKANEKK